MQKFSKRVREITNKYSSLSGQITSYKQNKTIQFESSLERDLIYLLEFDSEVKAYLEQPLKIKYNDPNNRIQTYTPDFIVEYHDDVPGDLIEVKYSHFIAKHHETLKIKFDAAKDFCGKNNLNFKVVTELDIRDKNPVYLENIKFLSRYKYVFRSINHKEVKFEIDFTIQDSILEMLTLMGKCSINELISLIARTETMKGEILFYVWYLMSENFIQSDLNVKLNLNSIIWKY